MMDTTNIKIGYSSRYYEPLQQLKLMFDSQNVFKLIHNEEKGTYSLPYLYENYKNELEPEVISTGIVQAIRKYSESNLFSSEEKQVILSNLQPYIENFGNNTINHLIFRIDRAEEKYSELISEYEKTITSLKQVNLSLNKEFSKGSFMTINTEPPPVVFISYSHDSDKHKDWVLQLATKLRSNGVNVILDRWNLKLGSNLASFMERELSKSNRVICICSDTYVNKANKGKGGAGYEKQIMTAELIQDQNTNWIIPLIVNNQSEKRTPTFLAGKMYISFEDSNLYESKYEELLRDLLDEPSIPPLGKNPFQI